MTTLIKTKTNWSGILLLSSKDDQRYITLVKDHNGLWGFPGGKSEYKSKPEINKITAVREAAEEVSERIFTRNIRKIWEGKSEDLNIHTSNPPFTLTLFRAEIPYFDRRVILNDSIVEARCFHLQFFLNVIVKEWQMRAKDTLIIKKLGKEFWKKL